MTRPDASESLDDLPQAKRQPNGLRRLLCRVNAIHGGQARHAAAFDRSGHVLSTL